LKHDGYVSSRLMGFKPNLCDYCGEETDYSHALSCPTKLARTILDGIVPSNDDVKYLCECLIAYAGAYKRCPVCDRILHSTKPLTRDDCPVTTANLILLCYNNLVHDKREAWDETL
jgi:hypothetical protein